MRSTKPPRTFECCNCGNSFELSNSHYRARMYANMRYHGCVRPLCCSNGCTRARYGSMWKGKPASGKTLVDLVCPTCGKTFQKSSAVIRTRILTLRASRKYRGVTGGHENLHCSQSCAMEDRSGKHKGGKKPTKKRGQSALQYEWELKLHDMGLGADIGGHGWLVYGYEECGPGLGLDDDHRGLDFRVK